MDFKRNAHYFSKTFARNVTILAVIGGILAVLCGLIWWYIYLGDFAIIVEIAAIAGAILAIAAFSQRPSEKYVFEQIETAEKQFREEAMEVFGYPADADRSTRLIWGFSSGDAEKATKEGKTITDQVEFALLWLKKGELHVYRKRVSLLKEEAVTSDTRLSLKSLSAALDRQAGTLVLQTADETEILPIFAADYQLEEFLDEMAHRKS